MDLCWRLMDRGWGVCLTHPMHVVYHRHRNAVDAHLPGRRYQYGTSEPQLQSTHLCRIKRFYPFISSATCYSGSDSILMLLDDLNSPISSYLCALLSLAIFGGDTFALLSVNQGNKTTLGFSPLSIGFARMRQLFECLVPPGRFFFPLLSSGGSAFPGAVSQSGLPGDCLGPPGRGPCELLDQAAPAGSAEFFIFLFPGTDGLPMRRMVGLCAPQVLSTGCSQNSCSAHGCTNLTECGKVRNPPAFSQFLVFRQKPGIKALNAKTCKRFF